MEKPKTQSKLQRCKPHSSKKTAVSVEESSSLDICYQATHYGINAVIIYIRPTKEDISKMLKEKRNLKSFIFNGVDVKTLAERVLKALEPIKYFDVLEVGNVIKYSFGYVYREKIYSTVSSLS